MGKYPVIFLNLKDVNGSSYDSALKKMSKVINKEVRRHQYLLESIKLTDVDKDVFQGKGNRGLLKAEVSWIAESNVESGISYTDIRIIIPPEKIGCIIEVKYADNGTFEASCQEAMEQIYKIKQEDTCNCIQ